MGWWPFTRKGADLSNDPQIRGTRTWLLDLQALCETHYAMLHHANFTDAIVTDADFTDTAWYNTIWTDGESYNENQA